MLFKCSLTVVIDEDGEDEVVTEERVASNPVIGLDLLWTRVKEQLSLIASGLRPAEASFQVLGWVDPILNASEAEMAMTKQKLLDNCHVVPAQPDSAF